MQNDIYIGYQMKIFISLFLEFCYVFIETNSYTIAIFPHFHCITTANLYADTPEIEMRKVVIVHTYGDAWQMGTHKVQSRPTSVACIPCIVLSCIVIASASLHRYIKVSALYIIFLFLLLHFLFSASEIALHFVDIRNILRKWNNRITLLATIVPYLSARINKS